MYSFWAGVFVPAGYCRSTIPLVIDSNIQMKNIALGKWPILTFENIVVRLMWPSHINTISVKASQNCMGKGVLINGHQEGFFRGTFLLLSSTKYEVVKSVIFFSEPL